MAEGRSWPTLPNPAMSSLTLLVFPLGHGVTFEDVFQNVFSGLDSVSQRHGPNHGRKSHLATKTESCIIERTASQVADGSVSQASQCPSDRAIPLRDGSHGLLHLS